MFDFQVYLFQYPDNGTELPSGLVVNGAPRRAARGREDDQIILRLGYANAQALPEITRGILEKASATYFQTPGTATGALARVAELVNTSIYQVNAKREGPALLGILQVAVFRRGMVYLAHCGPSASLVLSSEETSIFADMEGAGKGLGMTRTPVVRYFQAQVESGSLLILSSTLPGSWTETSLANSPALGMEGLRRRLLSQVTPEVRAIVIRMEDGNGTVNRMRWSGSATMARPMEGSVPESSLPPTQARTPSTDLPLQSEKAAPVHEADEWQEAPSTEDEPTPLPPPRPRSEGFKSQQFVRQPSTPIPDKAPETGKPVAMESRETEAEEPQPFTRRVVKAPTISPSTRRNVANGWLGFLAWSKNFNATAKAFFLRTLPKGGEPDGRLSAGGMLFIAIAVPILVVAIATTVYFRTGKTEQHTTYLAQAQQFAEAAFATDDAAAQRSNLQQSIYWLDKAESYQVTDRSEVLRVRVQTRLDELENITRINFTSAVTEVLPGSLNFTALEATDTDLYGLESNTGAVLRFVLAGGTYAYDGSFACKPGQYGLQTVGNVVDFVLIPDDNSFHATVLAADAIGNLMLCTPGEVSPMVTTITRPDTGLGTIKAMSISGTRLYVLDPLSKAVWRYKLQEDYLPSDQPVLFFGNQVPDLQNVIDLIGYGDELYLLRSSGKTTHCTYSTLMDVKQTSCDDPADYGDQREGRAPNVGNFPEAAFIQMASTQPPDPSLYYLDSKGAALYHFSLQLNLQRVLSPKFDNTTFHLNRDATAFAITPTRLVFMAFGNLLYVSRIP